MTCSCGGECQPKPRNYLEGAQFGTKLAINGSAPSGEQEVQVCPKHGYGLPCPLCFPKDGAA